MESNRIEENMQPEQQDTPCEAPKKKVKVWQVILAALASLVLLLTLTVAVWWSVIGVTSFEEGWSHIVNIFTPRDNDLYYKDSYTVNADKAQKYGSDVVATMGDAKLTNSLLQIYYWESVYKFFEEYGYYAAYMGLDHTKPLDEQACSDVNGTWQQFFLKDAISDWHSYQAMALMAQREGLKLDESMQTFLDKLYDTLQTAAIQGSYSSVDALVQADMGPGCTFEDYYQQQLIYLTGNVYFNKMLDKVDVSDAAIEAYFTANEADLKENGITKDSGNLFGVRHILIEVEGGVKGDDGEMVYSDSEWEACREKAQKLMDQWLAGEATEEEFAKLAQEHSADGGSKDSGGLYTGLDKNTNFVKEFVDWYMAEGRKVGDYGLIKTSYGYHIMYCADVEAQWIAACRNGLQTEGSKQIILDAMEQFPLEVDYKKIVLGEVNLNK